MKYTAQKIDSRYGIAYDIIADGSYSIGMIAQVVGTNNRPTHIWQWCLVSGTRSNYNNRLNSSQFAFNALIKAYESGK